MTGVTDNAPVLVEELDRRKEARSAAPGDQAREMALWEQATQLGYWFLVNHGTAEVPSLKVFQPDGLGALIGVYSSRDRAAAAAGDGTVIGVPVPAALDWLASYAQQGVAGIVLDHPGPWIPLANLGFLKRWLPEGPSVVASGLAPAAPGVQQAMDAYRAGQDDEHYAEVLRRLATATVLVVADPEAGTAPTHVRNRRGDRTALAFTDSARLTDFYADKAVQVQQAEGAGLLALVVAEYDALVIDPQHPSALAVTPEWIRSVLGDRRDESSPSD